MQCCENDNAIAAWALSEKASVNQSTRVLPSRVQADVTDNCLLRELDHPSWNADVRDAREMLRGLKVRRARAPINRLCAAMIESDAVMYVAALASTGAVAVCASAILNLPLAPVAIASGVLMSLVITFFQRIERAM